MSWDDYYDEQDKVDWMGCLLLVLFMCLSVGVVKWFTL